jgi:hypothetical protein
MNNGEIHYRYWVNTAESGGTVAGIAVYRGAFSGENIASVIGWQKVWNQVSGKWEVTDRLGKHLFYEEGYLEEVSVELVREKAPWVNL